ncbi:MAG: tetratricopeptide repeat protein [Bacteroidetes bacterium]|nr:tetratricopeptide repeat protein [Bacteroidota bacterium]
MKLISTILLFSILLFSCKEVGEKGMIKDIKKLEENKSFSHSDTLINSYLNFVKLYPDNPNAIKFLFKAAESNVKAKRNAKGAQLYEQLATIYMDKDELASESLIRAGLNYESLNDIVNAKRVYNEFLKRYPKHERAADIKKNIEIMGLSVDEMMKRIFSADSTRAN